MRSGAVVLGGLATVLCFRCAEDARPEDRCREAVAATSAGTCAVSGAAGAPAGTGGGDAQGGAGGESGGGTGAEPAGAGGESGGATVGGSLRLEKIALYQAVESTLMERGVEVSAPSAAIVAGRAALVRVFASLSDDWQPRPVTAELTVEAGGLPTTVTVRRVPEAGSTQSELGSTWNLDVPVQRMLPDATVRVRLVDERTGTALASWPERDFALGAVAPNGPFELVIVPVVAAGFEPDVTDSTLARYARLFRGMYPIAELTLSVRASIQAPVTPQANGAGWAETLDAVYSARTEDQPPSNVFYFGVVTPAASYDDYCPTTCTVGAGIIAEPDDLELRGAIGIGFFETPSDRIPPETMAHEIGHALGRPHSPCDTGESNGFPYADGGIGVFGFDGAALLAPGSFADVMGYCSPAWISDHTWNALLERIISVNAPERMLRIANVAGPSFRRLVLGADGAVRWGGFQRTAPELAASKTIDMLDTDGALEQRVDVPFVPFAHLEGGFLLVPTTVLEQSNAAVVALGRTRVVAP
jgi:hypothetical protein